MGNGMCLDGYLIVLWQLNYEKFIYEKLNLQWWNTFLLLIELSKYDVLKCSEQNKLHYFSSTEFFIISTDDIFTKQDAFTLTSNEIFVATDALKAVKCVWMFIALCASVFWKGK